MELSLAEEENASVLKLSGEIDLHASPALRTQLQAIASKKTPRLLVDFSAVEYIDSSGLATLIEYVRQAAAHKGRIALFGLKPKVRTIFDLVRLGELFAIHPTREEALAAIGS
jgi:anti-sigma B factor antagonist